MVMYHILWTLIDSKCIFSQLFVNTIFKTQLGGLVETVKLMGITIDGPNSKDSQDLSFKKPMELFRMASPSTCIFQENLRINKYSGALRPLQSIICDVQINIFIKPKPFFEKTNRKKMKSIFCKNSPMNQNKPITNYSKLISQGLHQRSLPYQKSERKNEWKILLNSTQ